MYPKKARFVTIMFCGMVFTSLTEIALMAPWTLTWILAAFAVPGAWKFVRVTYIWMQDKGPAPEEKRVEEVLAEDE